VNTKAPVPRPSGTPPVNTELPPPLSGFGSDIFDLARKSFRRDAEARQIAASTRIPAPPRLQQGVPGQPTPREFQRTRRKAPGQAFWPSKGGASQYNRNVCLQIEMPTPKGEHSFPCSTRVMFDGRIIFDGIATVKNFGSWILFPIGSQVKKKSGPKILVVTCSYGVTCGIG
jgi:hypothetical protein